MSVRVGFTCFRYDNGKILSMNMHGSRVNACYELSGFKLTAENRTQLNEFFQDKLKLLPRRGGVKIRMNLFADPVNLEIISEPLVSFPDGLVVRCLEELEKWPEDNRGKNFDYTFRRKLLEEDSTCSEHLFYDPKKKILDGTYSSFFALKGGNLICPLSTDEQVAGVFRQRLLNHSRNLGLEVMEKEIFLDDLCQFDEVFLTNEVHYIKGINKIIIGDETLDYKMSELSNITKILKKILIEEEVCQQRLF